MQILYPADMVNVDTSLQIGDTPLLPVPEMWTPVLTKREDANPSGSHYDRAYDAIVAALFRQLAIQVVQAMQEGLSKNQSVARSITELRSEVLQRAATDSARHP
jgi:hypothetical protein